MNNMELIIPGPAVTVLAGHSVVSDTIMQLLNILTTSSITFLQYSNINFLEKDTLNTNAIKNIRHLSVQVVMLLPVKYFKKISGYNSLYFVDNSNKRQ